MKIFKKKINDIYNELKIKNQLYLLCNADETSWRLAYLSQLTWAKKGASDVRIITNHDEKESFTSLCTITAEPGDHQKLPIFLLAKGETDRSHMQFGNIENIFPQIKISHSPSGWSNHTTMKTYLAWLRNYYDSSFHNREGYQPGITPIHLILDVHSSHRKEETKQYAAQLNIKLHFIPPGMTDLLQPLDIRIFGALKAKARAAWNQIFCQNRNINANKEEAAKVLASCWESLSNDVLEAAWEMYKHAIEEEEQENEVVPGYNDPDNSEEFHQSINEYIKQSRSIDKQEEEESEYEEEESEYEEEESEYEEEEYEHQNDNDDDNEKEDENIEEECTHEHWEQTTQCDLEAIANVLTDQDNDNDSDDIVPELDLNDNEATDPVSDNYYENVPLNQNTFMTKEEEIKQQNNIDKQCDASQLVIGLKNLGLSCYFNVFMQMILAIPNIEYFLIDDDNFTDQFVEDNQFTNEDIRTRKELKNFILRLHEKMITSIAPYEENKSKWISVDVPSNKSFLLDIINSPYLGAPLLLLKDILNTEKVSIIMINLAEESLIQTLYKAYDELKDILIIYRDNESDKHSISFPYSFSLYEKRYGLKVVITNPFLHFIAFKRIGITKRFFAINDQNICKVSYYSKVEAHMALYIRN